MDELFNAPSDWVWYMATVVLLIGAAEGGAAIARRRRRRRPDEADRFVATLAAPSIGLLALMIGFTFAMSISRFEARMSEVVDEANTIGTAALRGRMLPEPHGSVVRPLFKEYAALRVAPHGERLDSPTMMARLRNALEIQEKLWREAMSAGETNPQVVPTGMFVQALNEMIDVQGKRTAVRRNRVPAVIFVLLDGIAIVAIGYSSYGAHGSGAYRRGAMWMMAAMIGVIIALIVDLDSPQSGLITVSQQPLLDLIKTMK